MDQITHQVRFANWTKIIEQCSNRPQGTTVKQWLMEKNINDKSYYYWLRRVRQNAYSKIDVELPATEPPAVTFAEIPVPECTNTSYKADAMISTGSFVIGISNSISDCLLTLTMTDEQFAELAPLNEKLQAIKNRM